VQYKAIACRRCRSLAIKKNGRSKQGKQRYRCNYCTDEWESYRKFLPVERHWVGKEATQDIERNNLNVRTHLKRYQRETICFSRSDEMHDAVTKLYIYHLNQGHHF
jgi:insertion element IS1 protein InsB